MDVPIEVLIHIYKFLPHSDRLSCMETCRLWFEAGCDRSLCKKEYICFVKNNLQDGIPPISLYGEHSFRRFINFKFQEIDMSNKMSRFWNENSKYIKCLELNTCDIQERRFVRILNRCQNIETLIVSNCKELFMSARILEDLNKDSMRNLKCLDLSMNRYLTDALFFKLVSSSNNLMEINLSDCPISFHPGLYKKFYPFGVNGNGSETYSESVLTFHCVFNYLKANAHSIKKLCMSKTLIDGAALKSICQLPEMKLTHLIMNECEQLNFDGLLELSQCQRNLIELDLGKCSRLTDKSVVAISENLPNLKTFHFNRCRAVTNQGVASLWNLKKLENLNISQCEQITDDGIKEGICRGVNTVLKSLNLSYINMEESTVVAIAQCVPNLCTLNLDFCFISVTDKSIQVVFKHLVFLQSLSIRHCEQVSDAGLTGMGMGKSDYVVTENKPIQFIQQTVDNFPKISLRSRAEEEIVKDARRKHDVRLMCENTVGDKIEGYSMVRLSSLQSLDISGCNKITDVSLTYAFNFKALKSVNLSQCQQITHEGLKHLSQHCPSIETINLIDSFNIRDEGVTTLVENLKRLKKLYLRGCNLITDKSLDAIHKHATCLNLLDVQGCRNLSADLAHSLSSIPTLHTILISKPGPYVTPGLKQKHPPPPAGLPRFRFGKFF